jgi:hypothetical protein
MAGDKSPMRADILNIRRSGRIAGLSALDILRLVTDTNTDWAPNRANVLIKILRNSAFWTDYRQYGSYSLCPKSRVIGKFGAVRMKLPITPFSAN